MAHQGDRLPKPNAKDVTANQKYHERLTQVVREDENLTQAFTYRLLNECTSVGSSKPDLTKVCKLIHDVWQRAIVRGRSLDMAGYEHHSLVWIFIQSCRPAMDVIFASNNHLYSGQIKLSAVYALPLQTLFYQIQHLFGSLTRNWVVAGSSSKRLIK